MKSSLEKLNAFSLVEVTLALGVAAISLLAIFSLLPIGLQTNQRSFEQIASADILSAIAADLRATPHTSGTSLQFGISIPAGGGTGTTTLFFNSAGQSSQSMQSDSRYRVVVSFLPNGGGTKTATFADLQVTWPAGATAANAQGTTEVFEAFDRN